MAVFSPYEDLSPVARDNIPIHIPSGIPGEPQTTGTATIGTRTMPFPIQQDTASEQQGWVKRMNEFDRVKRETERAEQDAAYLKNLMMYQRAGQSAKQVENALSLQAMFKYDRDLKTGIAAGLSESQAALQALVRNPKVLGSGAGFGSAVRALQPPPTPTVHNLAGVKTPFVQMGNTGRFAPADDTGYMPNVVDVEGAGKVLRTGPKSAQLLKGGAKLTPTQLMARARQLTDSLPAGQPPPPAVQEQLDEIDRQLKELTMPSAPAVQTKVVTKEMALEFIKAAGGDKEKARKLARDAGFTF